MIQIFAVLRKWVTIITKLNFLTINMKNKEANDKSDYNVLICLKSLKYG